MSELSLDVCSRLVCPRTKAPLHLASVGEVKGWGWELPAYPRRGHNTTPCEIATSFLIAPGVAAYPVIQDIPVMVFPEALQPPGSNDICEGDPRYAEAYAENAHYGAVVADNGTLRGDLNELQRLSGAVDALSERFPEPRAAWTDSLCEAGAQFHAYKHLGDLKGKVAAQLGGRGLHAVKFLLAGAELAFLVTPFYSEVLHGKRLAEAMGVSDRFIGVAALAEELPLDDQSMDRMYSGGCLHHMFTIEAVPEISRVLASRGRYSAIDPWRVPVLYTLGTRLLGKREKGVSCQPLTRKRLEPFRQVFDASSIEQFGSFTRYPLIVGEKIGMRVSKRIAVRLAALDEAACRLLPPAKHLGSSVAVLAQKN